MKALALSSVMGLLVASSAFAHSASIPGNLTFRLESVTLRGEIIDPQCYFTHASRGPEHSPCAAMCAKGGQGLSFLDGATGIVYPLIAKTHGANQNERLMRQLGRPVQVTGVVYHVGPNSVLLVQSVAAAARGSR